MTHHTRKWLLNPGWKTWKWYPAWFKGSIFNFSLKTLRYSSYNIKEIYLWSWFMETVGKMWLNEIPVWGRVYFCVCLHESTWTFVYVICGSSGCAFVEMFPFCELQQNWIIFSLARAFNLWIYPSIINRKLVNENWV